MRVLHVITALGVGGAERMLLRLLGAPELAAVEQQVVAMLPADAMAPAMRAAGARVDLLDFLGGVPVAGGCLALARLARERAPDLVQGWLYHGNLGALWARAALPGRVPLVWSIRQSLASLEGENAWARTAIHLNRWWSGRPERLLFNSQASMAQHRDFGFAMARAQYLPNGFDTTQFVPDAVARARLRAEWGFGDDCVVFGHLARWHPMKDHAGFVRAAGRAARARPAVRLVLAGTGVDDGNAALRAAVAEAGLEGRVRLLGPRRDVAALLAALDVCVSSSWGVEGFSNTVGEAMACGVPCVVTAVGDSPHVVGDSGRVVPARDEAALAGALQALVDLGATGRAALGARARARVQAEFDLGAVARQYAALYGELAGG